MPPEQDHYLPIANVTRIMRNILPSEARISEEAKENIRICATEYISFVTAEANDICQSERRTTITAGDILSAMSKPGFEDYVGPLSVFINRYRHFETDPGCCSLRGESSLFDPAYGGSGIGFHGPSPHGPPPLCPLPYGPLLHGPPPHGPPPPVPNGLRFVGSVYGNGWWRSVLPKQVGSGWNYW
ncbi:Nuclear transcription factor Y subunit B-9 [Raphanus sativus]|uniref:Nuclear transcription factor Y subunit B-9-like n=1 Tax=Raphanus sativus TaxID=3726 RepID=A0A6J0M305_RAPSA|nr:nuclear transcription factor Y subunit B-9-like [Raphanus sativus]KAJ4872155.1 Nuclear transcription factor Y subunit B-9 [Raphanus sativus]